jgi:hypothetical protein
LINNSKPKNNKKQNYTNYYYKKLQEYNILNYSYDDSEYTWPIIMDGNKVDMKPGDIVVYRGVDLEHAREEFTPPGDDWHVQAFFHYVDANGPYSDHIYDKRESIGMLSKNKKYIVYTQETE